MGSAAESGDCICGVYATTILVTDEDDALSPKVIDYWSALGELTRKLVVQKP